MNKIRKNFFNIGKKIQTNKKVNLRDSYIKLEKVIDEFNKNTKYENTNAKILKKKIMN